jgi:hypothetical protein
MARSSPRQVVRVGVLVLALAGLGEAGHHLFERLGWEAGHHAFHLAYGAGAVVAFAAYTIRDVRRNGWPHLSWPLRADADHGARADAAIE